jgi:nucleotide-binding universal stress UspA family protein
MMRKLLVPIDDSPQATAAVEHTIAVHPDADITLLHVIEYTERATSLKRRGRGRDEGWYAEEREHAEEQFADAQAFADENDVTLSSAIENGNPANEIIDYATDNDFDQIVMGSHGRSGTTRILIGSVAEKVARRSEIPVTIVK